MVQYGLPWSPMTPYGSLWYPIVPYSPVWLSMVPNSSVWSHVSDRPVYSPVEFFAPLMFFWVFEGIKFSPILKALRSCLSFITGLLHVTSHGKAREIQGALMGFYTLKAGEQHNNKPVWVQDRQANKLFYSKGKIWLFIVTTPTTPKRNTLVGFDTK